MYDKMRSEFMCEIDKFINDELRDMIIEKLDVVAKGYSVTQTETLPAVITRPKELDLYLGCKLIEGLSKSTVENYKLSLDNFFRRINTPIQDIKANDIRLYLIEYQQQNNVSDKALDAIRATISRFFAWCVNEEYITTNPAKNIPKIKYEKKQRQALTREELEYVRREVSDDIRVKAIIEFMYSTGCRVSELCNVKESDIDFRANTVQLFGKGKKYRTSYLNAKCLVVLKDWLRIKKGDSPYLFVSVRAPYSRLTKNGIEFIFSSKFNNLEKTFGKPITPHIIRHTFATLGLEGGCELPTLSKILGHENISTTMIYAEVNDLHIQEAHRKYII